MYGRFHVSFIYRKGHGYHKGYHWSSTEVASTFHNLPLEWVGNITCSKGKKHVDPFIWVKQEPSDSFACQPPVTSLATSPNGRPVPAGDVERIREVLQEEGACDPGGRELMDKTWWYFRWFWWETWDNFLLWVVNNQFLVDEISHFLNKSVAGITIFSPLFSDMPTFGWVGLFLFWLDDPTFCRYIIVRRDYLRFLLVRLQISSVYSQFLLLGHLDLFVSFLIICC